MALTLRRAEERGTANFGWLDSKHSFSFGHYYDPNRMGFGPLRVMNEDRVAPGGGFPTHPHSDMEILTYVLDGALEHKDSIGTGTIIRPGDLQRMSAGTGIRHSEFNASKIDPVHFLQIWIVPERDGLRPSYEQRSFDHPVGELTLVGSRDGRNASVKIHQDVDLYVARLTSGMSIAHEANADRGLWLQVTRGEISIGDTVLRAGDGAHADDGLHRIASNDDTEFLLFDMKRDAN